jgi:formate dehydrogenase major subunit
VHQGQIRLGFRQHKDRLTKPLIREGDRFREATWDEALDLVARRFGEIKAAHGPDALAFIASSKCTNEEAFLMQKLARAVVGTNNVDNCSRYCQSPATMGLFRTVGYGGDSGSIPISSRPVWCSSSAATPPRAIPCSPRA